MSIDTIEEIIALWAAVYGEPPSISTDPGLMLQALVAHLPGPGPQSSGDTIPNSPCAPLPGGEDR